MRLTAIYLPLLVELGVTGCFAGIGFFFYLAPPLFGTLPPRGGNFRMGGGKFYRGGGIQGGGSYFRGEVINVNIEW